MPFYSANTIVRAGGSTAAAGTVTAPVNGTANTMAMFTGTTTIGNSVPSLTTDGSAVWTQNGGQLAIASGTQTASLPALNVTQTWNNGAVAFTGLLLNVTDTASLSSRLLDLEIGGSTRFFVSNGGGGVSDVFITSNGKLGPGVNDTGGVDPFFQMTTSATTVAGNLFTFNARRSPTWTSGSGAVLYQNFGFFPGSGSASFALLHLNPVINGTSSGIAYCLGIASKTNTLTGGTIKLLSAGTTTSDLFTGYTEKFAVDTNGAVSCGNTVNVVSPTAPNRTVTIIIGGTTYFLAAKTTND